jgi:hypothetical protein
MDGEYIKMKNIPNKIYLQIGSDCPKDEDFKELACVTWCDERIDKNDIVYIRYKRKKKAVKTCQ